ncbi:hypothetical protein PNH50_18960 (plasmid) [Leisingera aquaemixtae]|uniref:DUF7836 family putative zinc-binding protein n=1 Tax=Leisingera aquaemixtae TaxID=1396826 RepID=UPI003984243B
MFHLHSNAVEAWAEFECPVCSTDMDFELSEVPSEGEVFECPMCAAHLTVQHHKDEPG